MVKARSYCDLEERGLCDLAPGYLSGLISCFFALLIASHTVVPQIQDVLCLRAFAFAVSSAYSSSPFRQPPVSLPDSPLPQHVPSSLWHLSLLPTVGFTSFVNCTSTPTGIKAAWRQRFLSILVPVVSLTHDIVPDFRRLAVNIWWIYEWMYERTDAKT